MAIAIALAGFTSLVLDVRWPLLFFPESDFTYNFLHVVKKWTKNVGS